MTRGVGGSVEKQKPVCSSGVRSTLLWCHVAIWSLLDLRKKLMMMKAQAEGFVDHLVTGR